MAYEVKLQTYKDLSEEERKSAPNNGSGRACATYLRVLRNGETIMLESDACEPEDCSFGRDFGWIVGALQKAYELGRADASEAQ